MTMRNEEVSTHSIKELCILGLLTDGAHHKQWCLERILETCGFDVEEVRRELEEDDYEYEPGIAP